MSKLTKLIMIALCFALIGLSVVGLANSTAKAEATSKWNNLQTSSFTVNEDSSVSASTAGTGNAFNQSMYTAANANVSGFNDFAYSFNVKFLDNGIDQPVTFNYGIIGGAQINLTFYYQNYGDGLRGWTNAVIGGTNFVEPTLTMATYAAGVEKAKTEATIFTTQGFGFGAPIGECGLKTIAAEEGHDFVFRVTQTAGGVLIRIYYGTTRIDDVTKLFYSIDIVNEAAKATLSSFLGFQVFESSFTITNPVGLVKSNWHDAGSGAVITDNGNNTVTVVPDHSQPFQQAVFTTAAVNGVTGSDIAYGFNVKLPNDNNVGDQPITFNYGIFGGGQINMTFYYQTPPVEGATRGWTNAVIGATNFTNIKATMTSYAAGVQKGQTGPTADMGWGSLFAPIDGCGLKTLAVAEGHDFIVRVTDTEAGALVRIYYGTTCEKVNLFYSLDIECEGAKGVANSFVGFTSYDNIATISTARVFIPQVEEEEEIERVWTLINANDTTTIDYTNWDEENLTGSIVVDDKDATTAGFWKPQVVAKFADFYNGTLSADYDYAVTATLKGDSIGNKYSVESQFWFYYYMDSATNFGTSFQYIAQWNNAFAYGIESNAALTAVARNGKGNVAEGSSIQIEKTALPLAGLLTGTVGRERTYTTVYSVIEGKGVWIRVFLNNGEDYMASAPIYEAMLKTENTSKWSIADASFGFRFFNTKLTISNVKVEQVAKDNTGINAGAVVNGDLGIWSAQESLPAIYTAENGKITVDDSKSSPVSYGIPSLTASLESLANGKDYKTEKDFVIGFNVSMQEAEREMSLWFDLLDANDNYIGIGFFHQAISSEYVWTNSCVLSNAGNKISGYTYEEYGKTSVEFKDVAYSFEGVMAVPSVAELNDWGAEEGHKFYIRYTIQPEGEGDDATNRLIIRMYYDYGNGVNFYYDKEILKVVIYNYANADLEGVKFGFRAMNTVSVLSDVSFENASVLVEEGSKQEPVKPDDSTNTPDDSGNTSDTGSNSSAKDIIVCSGVTGVGLGGIAALVMAVGAAGLAIKKRRQ